MNSEPALTKTRPDRNLSGRNEYFFRIFKSLVRVGLMPFFRIETAGLENLPRNSAFVLLCKHQRWEDIPLLGVATPRPLYYIAKYELFKNALSCRFFSALGGIPLNRQRPLESRRFLQAAIALLEKGEGVVIFPEGTYYRNRMGPGQVGVVKFVASRLKLPFIPVGMNYKTRARRHRGRVRIQFGQAVQADPTLPPESFVHRMMKEIAALSGLPMELG